MPLGRDSLPLRANERVRPEDVAALEAKINATSEAPEKPDFTLNDTTPDDPGAVTKTGEGTYLSDDGTVFSYLTFTVPAMPADATKQFLLYRVDGDTEYMIAAGPFTNTGDLTDVTIRDLTPHITYDFALVAFSGLDLVSAIIPATGSPFLAPGDSNAPATPANLTAVVGTGKVVSLDWDDNTEADFSEYQIYRSTTSAVAGFSLIAETRASRFVDISVSFGTQYWYKVTAVDRSENVSSYSSVVTATPTVVLEGSVDNTVPGKPNAPTYVSGDSYLSGDGTAFAWIKIDCPGLPANAVGLNVLYKNKLSTDGYIVAAQVGAGAGNIRVDDLTPGVEYRFAVQAFSFSGVLSAVSDPLDCTAVGDTTAPVEYTGIVTIDGRAAPPVFNSSGVRRYGVALFWAESRGITYNYPKDWDHWEIKGTATNSDGASDYNVDNGSGTPALYKTKHPFFYFYTDTQTTATYFRIRSVDIWGNASIWRDMSSVYQTPLDPNYPNWYAPGGTMMLQNASSVAVSGGNVQTLSRLSSTNFFANDGTSSGITGGNANVDVKDADLRVYSGLTQQAKVDYATGTFVTKGGVTYTTRHATDYWELKANGANLEVYKNGSLFKTL